MSLYVAAYDVSDDRRREKVARRLLSYGYRLQQSVFEIWLEPDEVADLRRELGAVLAADDLFHLFPVDERGNRKSVAWRRDWEGFEPVVVL